METLIVVRLAVRVAWALFQFAGRSAVVDLRPLGRHCPELISVLPYRPTTATGVVLLRVPYVALFPCRESPPTPN
ncbi:hypothetical protein BaRGS_00033089 [Batillaria attramentaria]|uniref:Secreted protein n=1 Tax=Batillaria attramentaria TaxID=370345 RepID=A0ABD0JLT0_9CAEN